MATLSSLQVAAALAEMVYRRAEQDQALQLSDIDQNAQDLPMGDLASQGLTKVDNYYYDDNTGFVGRVVTVGDTVYVVFRGTDYQSLLTYTGPDYVDGNYPLGQGTTSGTQLSYDSANSALSVVSPSQPATQLDDALALTNAAIASAAGKNVVVVGQSLGGGLAGLVLTLPLTCPRS